jgi:molybdate transport system substrate-binding protein
MTKPGVAIASLMAALGCRPEHPPAGALKVAAASDLAFAFEEVGQAFASDTGQRPTFSFGSTGQLARQIAEGAPFDLFAAASVSFVDDVVRAGACDPATRAMYARGRIGVWSGKGIAGVKALGELTQDRFVKIAIANPEHAPYGRAAKQALEKAGLWQTVAPKIVYAENIQQTLKFAQSGNAEAAIVALSLASVVKDGSFLLIGEEQHPPIDQALVVCRNGANAGAARSFARFVGSARGREIMKRHGFLLPAAGRGP